MRSPSASTFGMCICKILGDPSADPPVSNCLILPITRRESVNAKAGDCVVVATPDEIEAYLISIGYTAESARSHRNIHGMALPAHGCVLFNPAADWLESTVGEWRKKVICQHEFAHMFQYRARKAYHPPPGASYPEKACADAYREAEAQGEAVLLLLTELVIGDHSATEKAKIKKMLRLATDRLERYIADLCYQMHLLPESNEWWIRAKKCKDFGQSTVSLGRSRQ